MRFLEKEADRLRSALTQTPAGAIYDRLYAAQQAVVWAVDPETFRAPYDLITGTPEGSEGCLAENGHSPSSSTLDHHAS
jgi:hypothetical protein